MPIRDLIAAPNVRPRVGQSPAPGTWTQKQPVSPDDGGELERIRALPRRARPEDARELALRFRMKDRYSSLTKRCRCATLAPHRKSPCLSEPRPVQAWALFELEICQGLFAPISVGHGKTMLDILAPLAVPECRVAVLLLPPSVRGQLRLQYELLREHWRVPSLVIHGMDYVADVPGAPVLHAVPYSLLSQPESSELLDQIDPDLVIADECDALRNAGSTRSRRVQRLMDRPVGGRRRRFAGWTGSPMEKSMMDFWHLVDWALRSGSPVPRQREVAMDWARAVDAADSKKAAPAGPLLDALCEPGEHVRSGFRRRLQDTIGVVTALEASCDAELTIEERPAPALPAKVADMLEALRETKTRPDGEILIEAGDQMEVTACACELACGFYYTWEFRRGESPELVGQWLRARKAWRKELRAKLEENLPLLDSPDLCARAAARAWGAETQMSGGKIEWRADKWPAWASIKALVKPETVPVFVDPFLVDDAIAWAREAVGVVWYQSRSFGEWIASRSGLPLHTGGPKAEARILAEDGSRSIIASVESHGRGRDGLQHVFSRQLITQPPAAASRWEQLLGRLHRPGAVRVDTWFYAHTDELQNRMECADARGRLALETLGQDQKLLSR